MTTIIDHYKEIRARRNNECQIERQLAQMKFTKVVDICDIVYPSDLNKYCKSHILAINSFTGTILLRGHNDREMESIAKNMSIEIKYAKLIRRDERCGDCGCIRYGLEGHPTENKFCAICAQINIRYIRNAQLSMTPFGQFIGYTRGACCISDKYHNVYLSSLARIDFTQAQICNFASNRQYISPDCIFSNLFTRGWNTVEYEICDTCAQIVAKHRKIRILCYWLTLQLVQVADIAAIICSIPGY